MNTTIKTSQSNGLEKKELQPIFDNAKSFYNKAYYTEQTKNFLGTNEVITLYSYNSKVCEIWINIDRNDFIIYVNKNKWNDKKFYSQTTMRHLKEFIKQVANKKVPTLSMDLITINEQAQNEKNNIMVLFEPNLSKKLLYKYSVNGSRI